MISEDYIDKIKSIILDYSGGINLMNNTVLSNLGIDSLDGVELMIRLESRI